MKALGIEAGGGPPVAMDWLRSVTIVSLLAIGVIAGGSAVRLGLLAGDRRAVAALALVGLFLLAVVIGGARSRRWRRNPYW